MRRRRRGPGGWRGPAPYGTAQRRDPMRKLIHVEDTERSRSEAHGVSLIETMIAVFIALIGVFSLGQVVFLSMVQDKNQGSEVTRATIYAEDKMEKLMSLEVTSCTVDETSRHAALSSRTLNSRSGTQASC